MLEKMLHLLNGLPPDLVVALISSAPVVELRGGIPAGVCLLKLPLWRVFLVAVVANIIVVTPLLAGFEWMCEHFNQTPVIGRLLKWAVEHMHKRKPFVDKYGLLALTAWFATPVPGFGAWSGVILGPMAGISFWRCLACLAAGTTIAGGIVSALTMGGVLACNVVLK
jgi:uncharacterized membrane protein